MHCIAESRDKAALVENWGRLFKPLPRCRVPVLNAALLSPLDYLSHHVKFG